MPLRPPFVPQAPHEEEEPCGVWLTRTAMTQEEMMGERFPSDDETAITAGELRDRLCRIGTRAVSAWLPPS